MALSELWPLVPHQTCHFHALQQASRPGFEEDGKSLAQMRETMQSKIRSVRQQMNKQREHVSPAEAEQLKILDEYALGIQTALTLTGKFPFEYAAVAASQALDEVGASLDGLEKKGSR